MAHRSTAHLWLDDHPGVFGDTTKARDNFLKVIDEAEDKLYDTIYAQKKTLRASAENAGNELVASRVNDLLDDSTKVVGRDAIVTEVIGNKIEFVWSVATVDWKSPEITRIDHIDGTAGKGLW
jgi:replication-associated recombination protein RarA